jgi:hypothetical protein
MQTECEVLARGGMDIVLDTNALRIFENENKLSALAKLVKSRCHAILIPSIAKREAKGIAAKEIRILSKIESLPHWLRRIQSIFGRGKFNKRPVTDVSLPKEVERELDEKDTPVVGFAFRRRDKHKAVLIVTDDRHILSCGGALARYGIYIMRREQLLECARCFESVWRDSGAAAGLA